MYTISIYTTTRTNTIAMMYTTARVVGCTQFRWDVQNNWDVHNNRIAHNLHTQYPLGHKVRKGVCRERCREVASWCVKDTREQEKNTRILLDNGNIHNYTIIVLESLQ